MRLQSTTGACATWPPPPPSQSRQILVGATMRHTGAGLAIPDFPLMPGGIVPDHWNAGIAIHFAHRVGAIVVAAMAMATSVYVWQHHRDRVDLAQASRLIITLIVLQVTFGALTVLGRRQPWINRLHVVGGAAVLTTSLVITLWSWRCRIADCGSRSADRCSRSPSSSVRRNERTPCLFDACATKMRRQEWDIVLPIPKRVVEFELLPQPGPILKKRAFAIPRVQR
jgi:heme A synthase